MCWYGRRGTKEQNRSSSSKVCVGVVGDARGPSNPTRPVVGGGGRQEKRATREPGTVGCMHSGFAERVCACSEEGGKNGSKISVRLGSQNSNSQRPGEKQSPTRPLVFPGFHQVVGVGPLALPPPVRVPSFSLASFLCPCPAWPPSPHSTLRSPTIMIANTRTSFLLLHTPSVWGPHTTDSLRPALPARSRGPLGPWPCPGWPGGACGLSVLVAGALSPTHPSRLTLHTTPTTTQERRTMNRLLFGLFALAATLQGAAYGKATIEKEDGVLVLTDANFDDAIKVRKDPVPTFVLGGVVVGVWPRPPGPGGRPSRLGRGGAWGMDSPCTRPFPLAVPGLVCGVVAVGLARGAFANSNSFFFVGGCPPCHAVSLPPPPNSPTHPLPPSSSSPSPLGP